MSEVGTLWVFTGDKWHQLADSKPPQTVCGLESSARRETAQVVLEDVRERRSRVCGTCERLTDDRAASAPNPEATRVLTPAQQEIRRKQQQEKKRRRARQQLVALDKSSRERGTSIRTVSGGIPGLGKKR